MAAPESAAILNLLKASDAPEADQRLFLKAQIVLWLLGATDGHAKNFSLHLGQGGRFRLAPFYDVMSTQPAVDAGQIGRNRMKLAMAVGRSRHYGVFTIAPRHFQEMEKLCGVAQGMAETIFGELCDTMPKAIQKVLGRLPQGFPEQLARSIAGGVEARLREIGDGSNSAG